MLLLLLQPLLFLLATAAPYEPGTPGAPWTSDEVSQTKAKLNWIMLNPTKKVIQRKLSPGRVELADAWLHPKAGTFLRLGFHDCLRYTDGSGGCDGCLEWKGVGVRRMNEKDSFSDPDILLSDNNGLSTVVEVLEEVYTNPSYLASQAGLPAGGPSLRETGKSRADLWALATLTAVEHGVKMNNDKCSASDPFAFEQCQHRRGEEGCRTEMPRELSFLTGRSDCVSQDNDRSYKASKLETHPWVTGNGETTLSFFSNEFGFNASESVAILGSHTMGKFHGKVSNYDYTWTSGETELFNNRYYRLMVGEDDFYIPNHNGPDCQMVGNSAGEKPKSIWVLKSKFKTKSGGPISFRHFTYNCPVCRNLTEEFNTVNKAFNGMEEQCCAGLADGQHCTADGDDTTNPINQDLWSGCEKFIFIFGADNELLPSEMGLYKSFEVTPEGIPYGCSGLDKFTSETFLEKRKSGGAGYSLDWSTGKPIKVEPGCPAAPTAPIVEEFARDQAAWLNIFLPTLEKMLANGYSPQGGRLVRGG